MHPPQPKIMLGTQSETVHIQVSIPHDPTRPLDIKDTLAQLGNSEKSTRLYLTRTKFVEDVKLLRAALYNFGSSITLEEAIKDIEDNRDAELQAEAQLRGYLAAQGWRPYDAIDGTVAQWVEATGPFATTIGGKSRVELGRDRDGDVLVSLATGITIVAKARGAYEFDWVQVPTFEKYEPRPYDRWWFVRNYHTTIGHDPKGELAAKAYKDLTIPEVPANLPAMLHRLNTEN